MSPRKDRFPVDESLHVQPSLTENESQFEAFQAILTLLLNADIDSPYSLLLKKNNIPLFLKNSKNSSIHNDGIFYNRPYKGSTHYITKKNGKWFDPYDDYQPKGTQGFCQLFAYFIYKEDVKDFKKVKVNQKVTVSNFSDYAFNSYQCLQKFFQVLKDNPKVMTRLEEKFKTVDKKMYGIRPRTTARQYLKEFAELPFQAVLYYIYDNPLKGWKHGAPRPELWEFVTSITHTHPRIIHSCDPTF
jgi:hypothetical protein